MRGPSTGTPDGHPRIRTFHGRHGRRSPRVVEALTVLGARHGLVPGPFTPKEVFGRDAPLVLEVGCGHGAAAVAYAEAHPHHDVVAVDVYEAGIATLLETIEARGLTNIRAVRGDAVDMLDGDLAGIELAALHLFFPDPWPKGRQHKRRFVRPDLLDLVAARLAPGAPMRVATDDAAYAAAARGHLDAHRCFAGGPAPAPPWRPVVGYAARARAAGRTVHELTYLRQPSSHVRGAGVGHAARVDGMIGP